MFTWISLGTKCTKYTHGHCNYYRNWSTFFFGSFDTSPLATEPVVFPHPLMHSQQLCSVTFRYLYIYLLHFKVFTCKTISCISPLLVKEYEVECTAVWDSRESLYFHTFLTVSNRHRWVSTSHCHRITPAPTQKKAGDNPQSQFGNKHEEKCACLFKVVTPCIIVQFK